MIWVTIEFWTHTMRPIRTNVIGVYWLRVGVKFFDGTVPCDVYSGRQNWQYFARKSTVFNTSIMHEYQKPLPNALLFYPFPSSYHTQTWLSATRVLTQSYAYFFCPSKIIKFHTASLLHVNQFFVFFLWNRSYFPRSVPNQQKHWEEGNFEGTRSIS